MKPLNILMALAVCWGASHAKGAPEVSVDRFATLALDRVHKEYPNHSLRSDAASRRPVS